MIRINEGCSGKGFCCQITMLNPSGVLLIFGCYITGFHPVLFTSWNKNHVVYIILIEIIPRGEWSCLATNVDSENPSDYCITADFLNGGKASGSDESLRRDRYPDKVVEGFVWALNHSQTLYFK